MGIGGDVPHWTAPSQIQIVHACAVVSLPEPVPNEKNRTEQHDFEINVQHSCFKIVNKLKSELLSYIIFEFFMWHYRKWVGAVIVVSSEVRIVDELYTSTLLGYESICVWNHCFYYFYDNK